MTSLAPRAAAAQRTDEIVTLRLRHAESKALVLSASMIRNSLEVRRACFKTKINKNVSAKEWGQKNGTDTARAQVAHERMAIFGQIVSAAISFVQNLLISPSTHEATPKHQSVCHIISVHAHTNLMAPVGFGTWVGFYFFRRGNPLGQQLWMNTAKKNRKKFYEASKRVKRAERCYGRWWEQTEDRDVLHACHKKPL